MSQTPSPSSPDLLRGERFMRLLLAHQQRIYGLILALAPNWSDADDLMQAATAVMWRKFDDFTPGSDFVAWAMAIARFEVMDFRKRRAISRLQFTDGALDDIAQRMMHPDPDNPADSPDRRTDALRSCLDKLPPQDRQLVDLRYEVGASTKSVADRVGRSVDAVYKALARIRTQLLYCIRRTLQEAE